jgi:glycolate oxidase FAD binding subunit
VCSAIIPGVGSRVKDARGAIPYNTNVPPRSFRRVPATVDTLSIDNSAPLPVRWPTTVADVCGIVKEARAAKQGLYPVGGRTTLDVGLPPIKPGVALDTTAMNRVIDYPARDMTITAQAGITIAALQAELAKEGQWLPIDVPQPERATLGGAIALNTSGPRRYGYGTLRDYVIGISFVTDDGVEVKAGGRVVKNVAGYDLMKLQIGAVGTLGVVTQVTLKVKPRPEASAAVVFGVAGDSLGAVLDMLHASKSRPVAVELLNTEASRAGGVSSPSSDHEWVIAVGFEEKAVTVEWQCQTLLDELKSAPVRDVTEWPDPVGLWAAITALQVRAESRYVWKAGVLPGKVADVARGVPAVLPCLVHASALSGVIWFHAPDGFGPTDHAKLPAMEQRLAAAGQHHYVMRRCPTEQKKMLRVWGRPTEPLDLMRTVKKTLDPDDVFNPGRLFGDV